MRSDFVSKKALIVLWVVLFSITALPDCRKIAEKVFSGFDLTLTDVPTIIPPIPVSYYPVSLGSTWAFNLDSIVKAETRGAFRGKDLTSVRVKQASLRLQNADSTTNLSSFYSVSIHLYSDNNTTPVTIVEANVPDTATRTLNFDTSNSPELLPYLQGSRITYVVTAVTRRPTLHALLVYTDMILAIK
ncbi:MAG: hypothetical protein M3342_14115 [Bacteroidota bacterium]|nr:hypothetical protein [Bacteroidota bacterium]